MILNWYFNAYALILFLFTLVNVWVIYNAWRQRSQVGISPTFVLLGITIWTLGYAIATGVHNLPERILWAKIQTIGISLASAAMPVVIFDYLGRQKWLTWNVVLVLSIVPVASLVLTWTNELHHLIWKTLDLRIVENLGLLDITYGIYYWFFVSYNFLIILFGACVFLWIGLHQARLLRQQATILFISTLFPAVSLVIQLTRLSPIPDLDLMPVGYSLCGWTLAWGLQRFQLFNLVPVARDAVIENMSDGVFVLDTRNRIIDANPALLRLISRTHDQVIGNSIEQVFNGQSHLVEKYQDVEAVQTQFTLQDGNRERHYEVRISPLDDRQALRKNRVVVVSEITERRQVEEALRKANERLEETIAELEYRNQEMILLNELEDLMKMSETPEATFDVIGSHARKLFPGTSGFLAVPDEGSQWMNVVASWGDITARLAIRPEDCCALKEGRVHSYDPNLHTDRCSHIQSDALTTYVCVPMLAMREIQGLLHVRRTDPGSNYESLNLLLVMAVADSIAAALTNLQLRESLRQQSIRDPLTGLFNRRYMEETFAREIMRAERSHYNLGVIMFDIDHFKLVNDHFGHPAGDTVLSDLGKLLTEFIRGGDVACRYGGEEFVLILPEAGLEDAFQKAEQLRQKVKQLRWSFLGMTATGISISLGVAAYPQHGKTVSEMLQSVDQALYRAKEAGRDRVML